MKSIVFDRAADIYDRTRGFPPGVGDRVAEALARLAPPDARFLDLGVGTGRIARPLLARGRRVAGVDLSRKMMNHLRQTLSPDSRQPGLVEADITRLPFPGRAFDVIVNVHVLHLIPDWQEAVQEMIRVRAPGGVVAGGWNEHPDTSSGARISRRFKELVAARGYSTGRPGLWKFEDAAPLFEAAGARGEKIVAAEWVTSRAPRQALDDLERRHFSATWMAPDEVFPAILAEVRRWALAEFGDLDAAADEPRKFIWMVWRWEYGVRADRRLRR